VAELSIRAIRERALGLAEHFCARLPELGLQPLFGADQRSQIVALAVGDPASVRERLAARGVVAAVRGRWLRVSFHCYNDESDVERVIEALRETG
jgi:selenocysteine lyase/cysteine desulfurase